jgi:hypothetical protein
MKEIVARQYAHEPNLVFGTGSGGPVLLLGMELPVPPTGPFQNCTPPVNDSDPPHDRDHPALAQGRGRGELGAPRRNTYLWAAPSANEIHLAERQVRRHQNPHRSCEPHCGRGGL